jgi:hypothetical protein
VEDLRNYILHYQHPFSIVNILRENVVYFGESPSSHIVYLYRDDLLDWKDWKKGKKFLDIAPEKIILLAEIIKYHEDVHAFYVWVFEKLSELHKDEISWYENKVKEFLLVQRK